MTTTTMVGTTQLAAYVRRACRDAAAANGPIAVFDPTGRFVWPRRIAARFEVSFLTTAAAVDPDDGFDPFEEYAGSDAARLARPDHLVLALTEDDEYAAAAVAFAAYRRATVDRARGAAEIAARVRRCPRGL